MSITIITIVYHEPSNETLITTLQRMIQLHTCAIKKSLLALTTDSNTRQLKICQLLCMHKG